jgi:hypothetical protein
MVVLNSYLVEAAMNESLKFLGLAPWEPGIEIIECKTPEGVVDMYAYSTLLNSTLTCSQFPDLSFRLTDDERARAFFLDFRSIQDLVFEQDPEPFGAKPWAPGRVKTFYGVEYVGSEDGPLFEVRTIVGNYRFRCGTVQFRWSAPDLPGEARPGAY